MTSSDGPAICAINFWPDFTLENGFLAYLLRRAFGAFRIAQTEAQADLVLTSVFMKTRPQNPERTIAIIWENLRPNFDIAHHALSSDFDSYGGRNCRCPYWLSQLAWPDYTSPPPHPNASNHGHEALVDIASLTAEREPTLADDRDRFCAFVAGNPEGHRMLAAKAISEIGPVDVYGNVASRPLKGSKLDLFTKYRFSLCFENSIFPGYYTEKPLHAWAAGTVPLYFSDHHFGREFNAGALVNRVDFPTLDEFRRRVADLEASRDARAEIVARPLLREPPTLEPVIGFLRETWGRIKRGSPPAFLRNAAAVQAPRIDTATWAKTPRNAPCPCGSGKKYKQCHGRG